MGSEFVLFTVWDEMYTLPRNNKSCLQCSSSMCHFRENGINEQGGNFSEINNRAGENIWGGWFFFWKSSKGAGEKN